MSRRKTFWIAYATGFLVAGIIAIFSVLMLHKLAPQHVNWQALQLTDLEGSSVSVEEYKGKVVVLNVWATWCKPCLQEMPALDRLQQLHPDKITILTLSDEETDKIREFRNKYNYRFRFLKAHSPLATQQLTIFPTTYIFTPNGALNAIYLGEQAWDSPAMQEKLLQLN